MRDCRLETCDFRSISRNPGVDLSPRSTAASATCTSTVITPRARVLVQMATRGSLARATLTHRPLRVTTSFGHKGKALRRKDHKWDQHRTRATHASEWLLSPLYPKTPPPTFPPLLPSPREPTVLFFPLLHSGSSPNIALLQTLNTATLEVWMPFSTIVSVTSDITRGLGKDHPCSCASR